MLLLCSPWGLTSALKDKAHELADEGFSVLAPDLNHGVEADDADHARELLLEADMNVTASLIQSSLRLLVAAGEDPTAPVGVIGYAAGASWALWLSARFPHLCAAVAAYYGTQSISFEGARARYLLHFAGHDPDVSDDDIALLGLSLQMAGREFCVEQHPDAAAGFAEGAHPNFDAVVEAAAWRQTVDFLKATLLA